MWHSIGHWLLHYGDYILGIYIALWLAWSIMMLRSTSWRYRDAHRLHMATIAGIKAVNINSPWYVRTVDKVLYRWMN